MKKLFLVAALAVSSFFAANAQLVANLEYARSLETGGGNALGARGTFLLGESGLKFGPSVSVIKDLASGGSLNIGYGAQARYFLSGDVEDGGFYPQADLGMTYMKFTGGSLNKLFYGVGAGYKLESGLDIGASINFQDSGFGTGKSLAIRVGMFF